MTYYLEHDDVIEDLDSCIYLKRGIEVEVEAPSRLHLGFLDTTKENYHRFGGIGLALESPKTKLEISKSDDLTIRGERVGRVEKYCERLIDIFDLSGVEIVVKELVPRHKGLGSGTSLATAIIAGLMRIYGLEIDLEKTAYLLGRGKKSGIGVKAARGGGFIVELGHSEYGRKKTVLLQRNFPKNWKFILVVPEGRGLYGEEEKNAFKGLDGSKRLFGEVCRKTLMSLVPAFKEKNLSEFGESITKVQRMVGKYFEDVQGGLYASEEANRLFDDVDHFSTKVYGFGQSSWGPSFYLLTKKKNAKKLKKEVLDYLNTFNRNYEVFIPEINNKGVKIN